MDIMLFIVCSAIIFLLVFVCGGTLIEYYFRKKFEYEMRRLQTIGKAISKASADKKD